MIFSACVTITTAPRETDLGNHHLSVTPDCQTASTHSEAHTDEQGRKEILFYEYKCGDTTVLIRGNDLTVNGNAYGSLKEGDAITVNDGGVTIQSIGLATR
jgi:hypothetical protein